MADGDSDPQRLEIPPQRLVSEVGSPIPQNQANPSKFYSHFLYKAVLVAVVLVILPLFPSQAPEFINQTILTRIWELLHLLFVGIAISYGLFSRRNVEIDTEIHSKVDSTQTYMSRILQVSSVFDDEVETPSGSKLHLVSSVFDDEVEAPSGSDESKIQTWSSRYFQREPVVVVAQENSVLDEQSHNVSNKPLLLPVRSLRSRVSDPDDVESVSKLGGSRSGSGGKGSSSSSSDKTLNGETRGLDPLDLEEKLKESAVLQSPIPWRSRSGRMEMKEEVGAIRPPRCSLSPSDEESEFDQLDSRSFRTPLPQSSLSPSDEESEFDQLDSRSFRSPLPRSSRPSSTSPSPKHLSPSPSISPELGAKNVEDFEKKKRFYKSSSPPAPSPPAPISHKSQDSPLIGSNSSPIRDGFSSEKKDVQRSFRDELKDLSRSSREDLPSRRDLGLNSLKSEAKPKSHIDGSPMGKSVRTVRASEPPTEARKAREVGRDRMDEKTGKKSKEVGAVSSGKTGRRSGGFDHLSVITEEPICESPHLKSKPKYSKSQKKKEKKEYAEKVILESEEDSGGEADVIQGSSDIEVAASNVVNSAGRDPNEVDKKADEFIAKFREQIRLQRIESIKRSSGQYSSRNSSR